MSTITSSIVNTAIINYNLKLALNHQATGVKAELKFKVDHGLSTCEK